MHKTLLYTKVVHNVSRSTKNFASLTLAEISMLKKNYSILFLELSYFLYILFGKKKNFFKERERESESYH